MTPSPIQILVHASELLTGSGIRKKDGRLIEESDVTGIDDGALVYSTRAVAGQRIPHRVLWAGKTSELPKKYLKAPKKNLRQERAVIPGLVDAHTHLVFSGDRSEEFALRCGGMSYREIAERGGGIVHTVRATRNATESDLFELACTRVREAIRLGVRTIEMKSGYGLDHATELKQLRVARRIQKEFPEVLFQSTYLGAHAFPPDRPRKEYLDEILNRTLPEVAKRKLADACDVFVDEGYFTRAEGKLLLEKARKLGLATKVHADELSNTASSELAAELNALSADHLLQISDTGIEALAHSETTAVLLPGTAFYLKAAHAPARRLIERGARVALATDFNPGTCMTLNLPAVMTIAALYLGMTRAELLAAVTYNAACALGFQKRRGTLEPGMDAAFAMLPFRRFEELYYRFAWSPT